MPRSFRNLVVASAVALAGAAGCTDFLTGGDLDTDPNRPINTTTSQLFVGVQTNLWALLSSDPARLAGMWTQQWEGTLQQYVDIYEYGRDESTTNAFHQSIYIGGGLPDVRQLQEQAREAGDSLFVGIGYVQEALLMGTAADIFGDVVYSEALSGVPNPKLDEQLAVYDAVQALLSRAIVNLQSDVAGNVGPGGADVAYGGDPDQWTRLAHTLKARFYLHTAEVRPGAYAQALAEARLGITDPDDDYQAVFSGLPLQQNFWYQFQLVARPGYLTPNATFIALLEANDDPRLGTYFNADQSDLAAPLLQPNAAQRLLTAQENLLIWAEAAFRTGNEADARTQLNRARDAANVGLAPVGAGVAGQALLRAILTEKYIALFQSLEVWNDYKRTCFPNVTPVVPGSSVPARLFYDTAERQTNTSIPDAVDQPFRNDNDLPNATSDGTGQACRGQLASDQ